MDMGFHVGLGSGSQVIAECDTRVVRTSLRLHRYGQYTYMYIHLSLSIYIYVCLPIYL